MKTKIILLVLFISTTGISAFSQPNSRNSSKSNNFSPEDMAANQTKMMKEVIEMDNETEKNVYDINLVFAQEMITVRSKTDSREEMRDKMKEAQAKKNDELGNVLTKEQFDTYLEYEKEKRKKRRK